MLFAIMLFSVTALAQDLPRIAVYISGDLGDNEKRALSASLLTALVRNGGIMSAEQSDAFLAELASEWGKLSGGSISNDQISTIGRQFDIKYVCIVNITPVFGEFHISARVIDIETAANVYIGEADSPLKTMNDLTQVADGLARSLRIGSRPQSDSTADAAPDAGSRAATRADAPTVVNEDGNEDRSVRDNRADFYITPKYTYPMTKGVPNWALGAEFGMIWQNGFYLGLEGGFGIGSDGSDVTVGSGLNIGHVVDLPYDWKLALGGFLGFWFEQSYGEKFGIFGPSIKLRYHGAELSYKMLVGPSYGDASNFTNHLSFGYNLQFQPPENRRHNKLDFYIAPRYIYPMTEWVPNWAFGLEFGMVWQNGFYLGFDVGGSYSEQTGNRERLYYEETMKGTVGVGLNMGGVIDLSDDWKLALGGFIGLWGELNREEEHWFDDRYSRTIEENMRLGIIGPSVKLRYRVVELSYRALIGVGETYRSGDWNKDGIGFIHQLSVGLHFQTSRNR
jgi:hypothetical protein